MSGLLDRLPVLATTGVGSLPFERAPEAVRHALAAYDLPFCPQLPRLDGDMVSEWLGGDPGRCGWTPDRDRERPAAWDDFMAAVAGDPPTHQLAKLQVTGPVTLAIALERGAGRIGAGAGVISLAHELAVWLAANSAGQVRRLDEVGVHAVLTVDEPGLAHAGIGAVDRQLWDPLRSAAPVWGMHVCGRVPWDLIATLELDLLSFDITTTRMTPEAQAGLGALLGRGARIAWGLLDPVNPQAAAHASGLAAARLVAMVRPGLPLSQIVQQSLITPSCGTGRLSAAREEQVAAALRSTAHALRGAVLPPVAASARRSPARPRPASAAGRTR